jgi:hypothetical protein
VIFRNRFADIVSTQLELFEREHGELVAACREARREWATAPRDEAEERYGDYDDRVEEMLETLAAMRDAYAATLDDEAAALYESSFERAAKKRFTPLLGR